MPSASALPRCRCGISRSSPSKKKIPSQKPTTAGTKDHRPIKPEPSRQSSLERGALRRGHAFQIERPPLLRGTRAERVNGGDEIAPAGGVGVESALGAKVFNAQPLAENGNIAAAENVPEKYVSEAVRGAFGVFPGKRFVKKRLVLQPNGLKFAHKNDLSVC